MKNIGYDYGIRSGWAAREETPGVVGARFLDTLDALSPVAPVFANWSVIDPRGRSSVALADARSRIATIVENNAVRDDFDEPDFGRGYHVFAIAGKFKDPASAQLQIDAGGKFDSEVMLEFGNWDVAPDPAILTYPIFKGALLAINSIWHPLWACAYAFSMDYNEGPLLPGAPLFPYSPFHIPWLAYLSAALVAHFRVPAGIQSEWTADRGLLMSTTEDRLDPGNPDHLRRACILAEALIGATGYKPSK